MPLLPVTLEGEAVRLEPLTREHYDALLPAALDPDLWRVTANNGGTPDAFAAWIDEALEQQAAGRALPFVLVAPATGRALGSTRYGNYDAPSARLEIGWTWVARPWQRTRVNTEAKYLLLRHAFEALGLERVELKTDAINARSRAAILRIGATQEGILRRHQRTWDGRLRDTVFFSILREEWPGVRERLEQMLADRREGSGVGGQASGVSTKPTADA
jgi:RimJ/RimL family protein N-acetyltransferase